MSATRTPPATIIACAACGKKNRVRAVPTGAPRCAACQEPLPWLVDASSDTFDAEITSSRPVLVDLWAPWCGPCKMMAPALEQLARERAGRLKVVKLNVDEAPAVAARYGVQGIPLLVLLRDGREVARLTGAAPAPKLNAWLNGQLTLHAREGD